MKDYIDLKLFFAYWDAETENKRIKVEKIIDSFPMLKEYQYKSPKFYYINHKLIGIEMTYFDMGTWINPYIRLKKSFRMV